jgi:hypothetical protein
VLRVVAQCAALVILTTVVFRPNTHWAVQVAGASISVLLAATAAWARKRAGPPPLPARQLWWRRGFIALWLLLMAVAIALGGGVASGIALALSFCAVVAAAMVSEPGQDEADAGRADR